MRKSSASRVKNSRSIRTALQAVSSMFQTTTMETERLSHEQSLTLAMKRKLSSRNFLLIQLQRNFLIPLMPHTRRARSKSILLKTIRLTTVTLKSGFHAVFTQRMWKKLFTHTLHVKNQFHVQYSSFRTQANNTGFPCCHLIFRHLTTFLPFYRQ